MSGEIVARGTVASRGTATGVLTPAGTLADVMALMREDLDEAILLTEHASVTAVVPILPRVRAVVCQGGGITSHLAIVSRQLGIPCVVAASFDVAPEEMRGASIEIDDEGRVLLAPGVA